MHLVNYVKRISSTRFQKKKISILRKKKMGHFCNYFKIKKYHLWKEKSYSAQGKSVQISYTVEKNIDHLL